MTDLKASVIVMAYRGMRIGALAGLTVTGTRFATTSKGKAWTGELPRRVLAAIRDRGRRPFEGVKAGTTAAHFKRITRRLAATGEIAHAYSVHDLRHFYAVSEYRKDKDIYRVCKLLNHSDVKTTMKYLVSIGA
jgi:integrase